MIDGLDKWMMSFTVDLCDLINLSGVTLMSSGGLVSDPLGKPVIITLFSLRILAQAKASTTRSTSPLGTGLTMSHTSRYSSR